VLTPSTATHGRHARADIVTSTLASTKNKEVKQQKLNLLRLTSVSVPNSSNVNAEHLESRLTSVVDGPGWMTVQMVTDALGGIARAATTDAFAEEWLTLKGIAKSTLARQTTTKGFYDTIFPVSGRYTTTHSMSQGGTQPSFDVSARCF
jgi:hypothetical protein